MKKWMALLLLPVLLTGCSGEKTLETVSDEYVQPVAAVMQQAAIQLPDGAAVSVMQSEENGILYFCDNYTITVQTAESGDLNHTLLSATGYTKDNLQLIQTQPGAYKRYDCVFVCAGEGEDQVGRTAVLDDGNYHYVLTCMAAASQSQPLQQAWNDLFSSFCLTAYGEDLYTGS